MNTPPQPSIPKLVIVGGVGLAVVITGLWAAYQFWSPEKATEIGTVVAVLLGALVSILLLIWLLWRLSIWIKETRVQREESRASRPRLDASPEEQAALDAMQDRLNTAVQVLRESKLARGRPAEEALYTLPWILLLGPPESGKTSVLRECGVDFPYTTLETHKSRKTSQIPACEYWFSRGAVVLDLAGRYAAGQESLETFTGFLDQLKRARKTRALDGIVVTVSTSEMLDRSPEEADRLANQLRQRFDLMIRRLGIRFPIYILFTQCDRVEGFKEFFGNMRSRDRAQIWGATISRAQRRRLPAEQIFEQEFDRLVEGLNAHRLQLLAAESDTYKLAQIFTFPSRFAAIRERLARFVGTLLEPTPYSERPMFRGFYMSSSAAAPPPSSAQAPEVPKWEPGLRKSAVPDDVAVAGRNFFLEDLFPKVIFADRPMATASVDTRLRRRLRHDIALAATVVLCTALAVFLSVSYVKNSRLLDSTRIMAARMAEPGWDGRSLEGLRSMEELRKKAAELDGYEKDGAPLLFRWGLYSGDRIAEPSRRLYYRQLRRSYLDPAAEIIRQRLYKMSAQNQGVSFYDFYNNLKTYLMMTPEGKEAPPEETFLNNSLEPVWKGLSPRDAEGTVLALTHLRFYAGRIAQKDQELVLTRDAQAVERSRQALRRYSLLERVYTSLKNEGNLKLKPLTLDIASGGKPDFLVATRDVPGIFTEAGWRTYFRDAIGQASKRVMQNDWVLGSSDTAQSLLQAGESGYEAKMREWYFNEYADEWLKFLEGISIRPFADLAEAKTALDSLSMPDYSIARLLLAAAQNTTLLREAPAQQPGGGQPPPRPKREDLVEAIAGKYAPLHDIATSPDGKLPSVISQYADSLGRLRTQLQLLLEAGGQWDQVKGYVARVAGSLSGDEFHEAFRVNQRVRQSCSSSRYTNPIPGVLEQPLRYSWSALLKDMGAQVDARWKTSFADSYRRDVEGMFPFNPEGQDLPLPTMGRYFRPSDGLLWSFYEKELQPLLASETTAPGALFTIRLMPSRQFVEFIERSKNVRDAFYGMGGADPSVAFDLTPEGTEDVTESILEIDGQPPLRYRNELPSPHSFSWPGKPGPPQARLSIAITRSAERPNIPAITGDWAFFRLLNRARVEVHSSNSFTVNWSPPSSDTRRFVVRYRLQARSANNPFAPGFLRALRCPDRVTQGLPVP